MSRALRTKLLQTAAVCALGAAATGHMVRGSFLWDDRALIVENETIRGLANCPELFSPQFWREKHLSKGSAYRPLTQIAFAIDYAVWHGNPVGFRATNVILYLASCALLLHVAGLVFPRRLAFVAAAAFALHPLHAEVVASAKNRAELLAGFSLFAALMAGGSRRFVLCCLLVLAGLASKQTASVFPMLAAALAVGCGDKRARGSLWLAVVISLVATFAYVSFVRLAVTEGVGLTLPSPMAGLLALTHYVSRLMFPSRLCAYYTRGMLVPGWGIAAGSLLLLAVVLLAQDARRVACGVVWALCALVPSLFLIQSLRPVADQRAYLAVAGVGVLLANALGGARHRRLTGAMGCAAVLLWGGICAGRGFVWRSDQTLWHDTVRRAPMNARAQNNLGNACVEAGRLAVAQPHFETAAMLDPTDVNSRFNLARIHAQRCEWRKAERMLEEVLKREPLPLAQKALEQVRERLRGSRSVK